MRVTALFLAVSIIAFSFLAPASAAGQEMSVEKLLENLETKRFSGRPVDLDLEGQNAGSLFSRFQEFSGLSFELAPDISLGSTTGGVYRFKHVPWDQILSLVLDEFRLEAVAKDGAVFIRPRNDGMMQVVREGEHPRAGPLRIRPWVFFLAGACLLAAAAFLLTRRRRKAGETPPKGFSVDPDKAEETRKRVSYLFDVEKVYRNEDLSLQSLAKEMSIPAHQLSWVINKEMKVTFSELVNSRRVEEVKRRLAAAEDADKTLLDIAFDAGFKTKTSFNRVFKKLAGATPSEYRKTHQPQKTP
jgi:LPXTG-motif cell wall-anchored protein